MLTVTPRGPVYISRNNFTSQEIKSDRDSGFRFSAALASLCCVCRRWLRKSVAPAALDDSPAKHDAFRENYRHSFGPSFPGMACQTLFFRILPAPKNTLFCLCFGAPRIFSKPRFSTLTPFLGSPSGRFFSDFRPNGVFSDFSPARRTFFGC